MAEVRSQHRKHDRFSITLNVYNKEGNLIGVTKNISREGIFIETDKDIDCDEIYMALSI